MVILKIICRSFGQRAGRSTISILALALSIALLLVISHIHEAVRSYARQVSSGADLIVGAPSQPVHLALYSLFRIGPPPPVLPWNIYEEIAGMEDVEWAAPVSTNESHRGYTVTGSTAHYMETLQLKALNFIDTSGSGTAFRNDRSAFIGANLAAHYQPGETLTIANGFSPSLKDEYQTPFVIQGVLMETGTLLDSNILVPIEGLRKIRKAHGITTDYLNFIMIKLRHRHSLFKVQQELKSTLNTPLEVVIPAFELEKLGHYQRMLNNVFMAMSFIIGVLSLMMMYFNLSAGFAERKQEVELLRMVGASPWQLAGLTLAEPMLQILVALCSGVIVYKISTLFVGSWIPVVSSITLPFEQLVWLLSLFLLGFLVACLPAWRMYGFSRRT
ncbi:ABC transporter permease [Endozoicomonas sp. ONNA2]|uniref:ABC transporter permease n=1 Tax=Endozoicomonas sp. ONNA2 TaxID=2828741 RepID=UPI00214754AE|nr:ABC transporter permease [Endozoicomonas sp. ONNA2]